MLPQIELPGIVPEASPSYFHPYTQFVQKHLEFRLVAEPWQLEDDIEDGGIIPPNSDKSRPTSKLAAVERSSRSDLKTINSAFPCVRSANVIICMAAWFRTLCEVDDLTEPLPAAAVPGIMRESMHIVRKGYNRPGYRRSYSTPAESCSGGQRNGELGDGRARWCSRCNHFSACLSYHNCEVSEAAARIRCLLHTFRVHVQALLPERVYVRFAEAICSVWAGMIAEAGFCENAAFLRSGSIALSPSSDLPMMTAYMSFRERSIGVVPFFVLLESSALPAGHIKSPALAALERSASIIVVLQNDLCGLEKDLASGNISNSVVIASEELREAQVDVAARTRISRLAGEGFGMPVRESLEKAREGIVHAVTLHNEAVEMATQCWEEIFAGTDRESGDESSDAEREVASEVFNFITRYYDWASKAQRYQVVTAKGKEI